MAKIFKCENCNVVTEKAKCLLCGKKLKEMDKKKIQRFPREYPKEMQANKEIIKTIELKCAEFDCPGKITEVKQGPIVTQYNFTPDKYVRVKRIRGMYEDLAMALGTDNVTITRIPGESAVAIMVPNAVRKVPSFNDLLPGYFKYREKMELPINCGVDSLGNPIVIDLTTLPHLLIAGETGAGKSVFLNNIVQSLLWIRTPKQLKFILIDSKQVELDAYKTLPHLDGEPATDIHLALRMLERAEREMRQRMGFINVKNCKNLRELNAKLEPEERLPYIVIVIDEIADLILQEKKEFTKQLAIISSMARASGVHIIAATQRPSVDVLSGKIKVNFPTRIAFHVPSSGDSKTILMTKGAEQLMGKGDAFAILPGRSGLTRLHTPMVGEAELKKILRASLAVGHHLRIPADMTEKEWKQLDKDLAAAQKANVREQTKSIADMMDESATGRPN